MGTLAGKMCVITGATSGIGRAMALQWGRLGANLILIGRNERGGTRLIRRLKREGACKSAIFMRTDRSVQREVRDLAANIRSHCASVDVLINNAGVYISQACKYKRDV